MEFRDLKTQYEQNRKNIETAIQRVLDRGDFISGREVAQLEERLASYINVSHCITCGNGTDALELALMAWGVGRKDAVFVPDFTFFATAEVVPRVGATPIFVDVEQDTFNLSPKSLEKAIEAVIEEGKLTPKAVIAVDLFGQPADYQAIKKITDKFNLLLLEDGAQGFGGGIGEKRACSFGDISTTSFFPAKPLGCYGDGGAIFTDNDEWAELIRSYRVHGKGINKYDNIRIGINSRLDTLQAAILMVKLDCFLSSELEAINRKAEYYTKKLESIVITPTVARGYLSSWAQYTIRLKDKYSRDRLQNGLKKEGIPSMVYYAKPIHEQRAFADRKVYTDLVNAPKLCEEVLSLPIHPYLTASEQNKIISTIENMIINQ